MINCLFVNDIVNYGKKKKQLQRNPNLNSSVNQIISFSLTKCVWGVTSSWMNFTKTLM